METEPLMNIISTPTNEDVIASLVNEDIIVEENIIEHVEDISKNDISEVIKLSLIQLIENLLKNNDELKKININLTPEIILFIQELLKIEPQLFEGIELSLQQIISDNKINSNDIPNLLVLITQVYDLVNKHKNNIKNVDYYDLVKNILHIIFRIYIEKNCKDDELLLVQSSLRIIDSSIELIKLRGFQKEKNIIKKIISYFKKCSCKC